MPDPREGGSGAGRGSGYRSARKRQLLTSVGLLSAADEFGGDEYRNETTPRPRARFCELALGVSDLRGGFQAVGMASVSRLWVRMPQPTHVPDVDAGAPERRSAGHILRYP